MSLPNWIHQNEARPLTAFRKRKGYPRQKRAILGIEIPREAPPKLPPEEPPAKQLPKDGRSALLMAMRFVRTMQAYRLGRTLRELAADLEVTQRQASRVIEYAERAGLPIYQDTETKRWRLP